MCECCRSGRFELALILTTLLALAGCGDGAKTSSGERRAPKATPAAAARAAQPAAAVVSPDAATFEPPKPSVRLEEVLYRPASGEAPFVELANVGTEPVKLSALTLLLDSAALPLEAAGGEIAAGAHLLVVLDGPQRAKGETWHAGETIRISADAGRVAILDKFGRTVDDVAWGKAPGAVNPFGGGIKAEVESGGSIGRAPGAARLRSALSWVGYPAAEVTPGKANPPVQVRSMHPLSGAITTRTGAELSWFPVPGAAAYGVQVGTDESFARVVLERSVTEARLDVSSLAAGRYLWRVRSKVESGAVAGWSETAAVTLADAPGAVTSVVPGAHASNAWHALGRRGLDLFVSAAQAQASTGPALSVYTCPQNPVALLQEACVVLRVRPISQHKDTRMLLLEHPFRTGTHAWDVDHGDVMESDAADNGNCALAAIAMMNRYAGGDLSQDRIGYEVLKNEAPGPETDLMYGQGLFESEARKAYKFALGTTPEVKNRGDLEVFWGNVKTEIDAGRPMLAQNDTHFVVVVGYYLSNGERVVVINDPWTGRQDHLRFDDPQGLATVLGFFQYLSLQPFNARHEEASVTQDGDGDGVVDFDETERFHTSAGNNDTDADGVNDKNDIAASVFDATYGYAIHQTGRDEDHDGRPMELDRDSDDGGCKDGDEDLNGNGDYEGSVVQQVETWNFKILDDSCRALAGNLTYREKSAVWVVPDVQWAEVESQTSISVRLKPEPGQPGYYEDDGSTFHYRGSHYGLTLAENCRVIGRSWAGSSGNFTGDGAAPATGQIMDDGRLAVHFSAGIPWDDTGGWASMCGVQASGKAGDSHSAEFRDECLGDPVEPGEPGHVLGQKTFRFNCHDQHWSATGTVIVP